MRITDPPPSPIYVATIAPGRTLALGRMPDTPLLVIEDSATGERLGSVLEELTAFYVEVDGAPRIVLAGVDHPSSGRTPRADVELLLPDGRERCRMFASGTGDRDVLGCWMSFPQPFRPGMRVTAIFYDADGREAGRCETPPLERSDLEPRPPGYGVGFAPAG